MVTLTSAKDLLLWLKRQSYCGGASFRSYRIHRDISMVSEQQTSLKSPTIVYLFSPVLLLRVASDRTLALIGSTQFAQKYRYLTSNCAHSVMSCRNFDSVFQ
jgi:hypothetical protein